MTFLGFFDYDYIIKLWVFIFLGFMILMGEGVVFIRV